MAPRRTDLALIGRERELAALTMALDRADAGLATIAIVAGDAGIGKTSLVNTLAIQARRRGGRVLVGGCLDLADNGLPYAALIEGLRGLARELAPSELAALLGPASDDLRRLLPGLGPLVGTVATPMIPAQDSPSPSNLDQARLYELVLGMLGSLAGEGPGLLIIEDLHWVDRATQDLIRFLARNLERERLLVVLTVRTDGLSRGDPVAAWLASLERDPETIRLDLEPLDRDAVERQMEAVLGSPPDRALVERVIRRSGGNPFFVEELLKREREGGTGPLPRTLMEILTAQIAGLPDESRAILGVVAVGGRAVDERLVAAVVEVSESDIRESIRVAIDRGVLVMDHSGGPLRLRHALLAEVSEANLLPAERRTLHERYAQVLTDRPDLADPSPAGAAGELAHHWFAADRPLDAYRASIVAARAAEGVFAYASALRLYERAIELEPRLDPAETSADAVELRRWAGQAADEANESDRAIAWLRDALSRVDETVDPVWAGVLHSRLGYSLWIAERNEDALAEHREAIRLVPGEPPTPERARVLVGYSGCLMGAGRYGESASIAREAIEVAHSAGSRIEEGRARSNLGQDLVSLGQVDAGIAELEAARRLAEEVGPFDTLIVATANLAYQLIVADRFDEAYAAAIDGGERMRAYGLDRRFGSHFRAVALDALFRAGRWDEAAGLALEGLGGHPEGIGSFYLETAIARQLGARGEAAQARAIIDRLAELATGDIDADVAAFVWLVDAELANDEDRPDLATTAVTTGLQRLAASDDTVLVGPLCAAGLRAAADRAERARALRRAADIAAAEADGSVVRKRIDALWAAAPPSIVSARGYQALCVAEAGRLAMASDPTAWRTAADAWASVPMPHLFAYARFRQAEAHLIQGSRPDAETALVAALDAADALRATSLLAAIDGLARRARLNVSASVTPAAAEAAAAEAAAAEAGSIQVAVVEAPSNLGLSKRELEVLTLVAAGRTNGQIAQELFISPKTASVHVTHILDKLGVSSRIEAAMIAAHAGIAAPDSGEAGADRIGSDR
jgi:DNA-binding NarL/FixJ family response regulator